jgi:hypothetical protein
MLVASIFRRPRPDEKAILAADQSPTTIRSAGGDIASLILEFD